MNSQARRRTRVSKQGVLDFKRWGGVRPGAGRPPNGERAGVPHLRREPVASRHPVHITTRLLDIQSLRRGPCFRVVRKALSSGCSRDGFRVVEFSVMHNHIHLICEAHGRRALARGMQGLLIRIARQLNKRLDRKGKLFSDRYHSRVLKTPQEVRNAIAYVLNNARRHAAQHGRRYDPSWIDHCSSGIDFQHWTGRQAPARPQCNAPPLPQPRSWLLTLGWKRAGPIRVSEVPGKALS